MTKIHNGNYKQVITSDTQYLNDFTSLQLIQAMQDYINKVSVTMIDGCLTSSAKFDLSTILDIAIELNIRVESC